MLYKALGIYTLIATIIGIFGTVITSKLKAWEKALDLITAIPIIVFIIMSL